MSVMDQPPFLKFLRDGLDGGGFETDDVLAAVLPLMRQVLDAPRTQFAAPGLGETWRLFAPQVSGGGLTAGGKPLHMSAFRA